MILFILSFAAKSIKSNGDNIIYISSDLLISCMDGQTSDYSLANAKPIPFLIKETIMDSDYLKEKINTMKMSKSFSAISNLRSKVKMFLFKYDDYPMILLHNIVVFMDDFYEFYNMTMKFYNALRLNRQDVSKFSISLYKELVRIYGRERLLTKADTLNMVKNTLKSMEYTKNEIYSMELNFRSRTSESIILGFYYISNILDFKIREYFTVDFGSTTLNSDDKYNLIQVYNLKEGYKIYNIYNLVEMYKKFLLIVEVKSRLNFIN